MCVGVQLRADVKRQEAAQELGNVEGYRKQKTLQIARTA